MNTVKDFRLPRKLTSICRRECKEECRDYNVVQEKQEGRFETKNTCAIFLHEPLSSCQHNVYCSP